MKKSPQAFRTIREVADWLGVEAHVLRFWESKFAQIKPVKRAGGRRYYRPSDMKLVGGIKVLLHDEGMTIRGVQKLIREEGVGHIATMSPLLAEEAQAEGAIEAVAEAPDPETTPAAEDSPFRPVAGVMDTDAMAAEPAPADPEPESEPEPQAQPAADQPAPARDEPEPAAAASAASEPHPHPRTRRHDFGPPGSVASYFGELRELVQAAPGLSPDAQADLRHAALRLEAMADRLQGRAGG